ncbi:MAG: hypothetical protein ACHQ9S_11750 [Candidatus Binatia bacterium]
MKQFWSALHYFEDHPAIGLIAVGVLLVYYLLNRKPRLTREAEERLKELRKERGDYYRRLRPPQ